MRSAPRWSSSGPARSSRSTTWSAVARSAYSPANGPTTRRWPCAWPRAWSGVAGFDATDQMQRYVRWWREDYLSSTKSYLDIGNTVSAALSRSIEHGDPYAGSTDPYSVGNGSLMRLAPVPMCFAGDATEAMAMAGESSRTTHQAQEAVDACRYFAGLLIGALRGVNKETLLSPGLCPVEGPWERDPLAEKIARVADGSFKDRNPPDIRGTGYVVDALEAALWAFHRSDDFRKGALLAVNLGDDADTNRSDLRTDHRRPLRSGDDSSRLAQEADDGGGDHFTG